MPYGDSDADLSLIAEWAHDGRGRRATTGFENDLLLAARLGLNDEQSTEFTVGVLGSLDNSGRVLNRTSICASIVTACSHGGFRVSETVAYWTGLRGIVSVSRG